jgi:hypothetical protein
MEKDFATECVHEAAFRLQNKIDKEAFNILLTNTLKYYFETKPKEFNNELNTDDYELD